MKPRRERAKEKLLQDRSSPPRIGTFHCPLCHTELPVGATSCTNCDWVEGYGQEPAAFVPSSRDIAAVFLSIIPGLGHYFKGHHLMGITYFLVTFLMVFFIGAAGMVGMGFNLLLLPLWWGWVMLHAYLLPDWNRQGRLPQHLS